MDRFSQRYLKPTELSQDSRRMRVRLDGALNSLLPNYQHAANLASAFRPELGVSPKHYDHPFADFELRDVLDGITIVAGYFRYLDKSSEYGSGTRRKRWITSVATILREEHVAYQLDEADVVQFAVDADFDHSRETTLVGLGAPRFGAARREYEEAFKALRGDPPNGKAAIRGVFTAVETVFKLMFERAPRLGGAEIRTHLKLVVARTYAGDATSLRSMEKAAESFMDWVEAAHWYRHAQGEEEPSEPPLEATVLLISQGSAFLRWLMTVDAAELAKNGTGAELAG